MELIENDGIWNKESFHERENICFPSEKYRRINIERRMEFERKKASMSVGTDGNGPRDIRTRFYRRKIKQRARKLGIQLLLLKNVSSAKKRDKSSGDFCFEPVDPWPRGQSFGDTRNA